MTTSPILDLDQHLLQSALHESIQLQLQVLDAIPRSSAFRPLVLKSLLRLTWILTSLPPHPSVPRQQMLTLSRFCQSQLLVRLEQLPEERHSLETSLRTLPPT